MDKEIYLVTSYVPTLDKQDKLRELINVLYKNNKKICLVSHTHVPQDIIERVNYYFYDEENKLTLDKRFTWKHYNHTPLFKIESRLMLPVKSTFFPYLRLFWFGVKICKFLGYNIAHILEYDTKIKNFTELDKNSKLLKQYDCIFYTSKRIKKSILIQGSYTSINPQSISDDFFTYDEVELQNKFTNHKLIVENFQFDQYFSKLNFLKKPIEDLESSLDLDLINNTGNESLNFTLFFNPDLSSDEEWFWYAYSNYNDVVPTYRDFELVINNRIIPLNVAKWSLGGISKNEPLKQVKFIYNNKIITSFDMTDSKIVNRLKKYNIIEKKH